MENPMIRAPMPDKRYLVELTIETESGFQFAPYDISDITIEKSDDKYSVKYKIGDDYYTVKSFNSHTDANIFREKFSKCLYQAYHNRMQSGISGPGQILSQDVEHYRIT